MKHKPSLHTHSKALSWFPPLPSFSPRLKTRPLSHPVTSYLLPHHPTVSHRILPYPILYPFISSYLSYLLLSHPASSYHPFSSYLTLSHPISSFHPFAYLLLPHPMSNPVSSILPHPISSLLLSHLFLSNLILSPHVSSHPILSHPISPYLISPNFIQFPSVEVGARKSNSRVALPPRGGRILLRGEEDAGELHGRIPEGPLGQRRGKAKGGKDVLGCF